MKEAGTCEEEDTCHMRRRRRITYTYIQVLKVKEAGTEEYDIDLGSVKMREWVETGLC